MNRIRPAFFWVLPGNLGVSLQAEKLKGEVTPGLSEYMPGLIKRTLSFTHLSGLWKLTASRSAKVQPSFCPAILSFFSILARRQKNRF